MKEISLYGPGGKPDWFLQLNPKGTVPVLVCHATPRGDTLLRPLTDSDEILDRFCDAVPGGSQLVPGDKKAQIAEFRSTMSTFLPIGKNAILGGGGRGGSKAKLWEKMVEIDSLIQGPYVCGHEVTVADCAAFPFLWRIQKEYGGDKLEENGCSSIKAWLATCERNEAFSKTIQSSWWWWW
jgi:glutathione S-transferase